MGPSVRQISVQFKSIKCGGCTTLDLAVRGRLGLIIYNLCTGLVRDSKTCPSINRPIEDDPRRENNKYKAVSLDLCVYEPRVSTNGQCAEAGVASARC